MECMILFTKMILYTEMYMRWGWDKQTRKRYKKNSVWLTSHPPLLPYGGRLFSGVREHPKTSWTYPKWEGVHNLMGQKRRSWVGHGKDT